MVGDAVLRNRAKSAEQMARLEMELASRVKSDFISNMSHELRTPLNTVIGFSKLLSNHANSPISNEDLVQYAELIHKSAEQLLAIINDILDISKIQSGGYSLDDGALSVNEIVDAVLVRLAGPAEEAKVQLTANKDTSLPEMRGDAAKLGQAIENILSNAIRFTPEGNVVVTTTARPANDGVCIVVSDTGVGMTQQEIDIALAPFGQVDGARSRWREGTGLGLPIARALVELHGGEISISSNKGNGTEVSINLPSKRHVPDTASGATAHAIGVGQSSDHV